MKPNRLPARGIPFYRAIQCLWCATFLLVLIACGSDDDGQPTASPGEPAWVAGFPRVAHGAVSVDLRLQTDRDANVYWIISDKSINLDSETLKSQALAPTNEAIKFRGTSALGTNIEKVEVLKPLAQNTKYFAYIVAESKADTVLQADIQATEFTTHVRQATKEFSSGAESRKVLYLIYRPEAALKYPEQKHPICFFLGGNGEVADPGEINMIRNGSLPEYIDKGNDVPMMVMSIQQIQNNWNTNMIDEGVNHGLATYPVDTKRVYMTGISGGGFGCWNYAVDHAAKLTAIVPISGGGSTGKACNLKNVPVYAFHNQTDGTVGSNNSVNMVNAVNGCSPTEQAKLLLFPDTGHDCWRRVYDQNHKNWSKSPGTAKIDIYAWMLSKTK